MPNLKCVQIVILTKLFKAIDRYVKNNENHDQIIFKKKDFFCKSPGSSRKKCFKTENFLIQDILRNIIVLPVLKQA